MQRLALFFRTLRDTLRALAPRNRDNPRIVLLTPGPYNETYFEHAYLARYLGYTLVEGGDLTVRDNRVFLKVLGGLQPVDVIFRRLDDDFCDPLELRRDSFLGVPGLVQAVRSGNVAVANRSGSGLLETPALLAVPAPLCAAHLLGEELQLPSLAHLVVRRTRAGLRPSPARHDWAIKPAFPRPAEPVRRGLPRQRPPDALAAVSAPAEQFVAQERAAPLAPPRPGPAHRLRPTFEALARLRRRRRRQVPVMPGGSVPVSVNPAAARPVHPRPARRARTPGCWPTAPCRSSPPR